MAPKHRLFQARFSATLLRSAALAISLLVLASPTRSEVLDLYCKGEGTEQAWSLLIDTDKRTVKVTNGDDNTFTYDPNAFVTHKVIVSSGSITWEAPMDCGSGFNPCSRETRLDRIGGTLRSTRTDKFGSQPSGSASCRRATQKF